MGSASTRPGLWAKVSRVLEDVRLLYLQPAVQRAFPVLAAAILVVLGLSLYLLLQAPQRTTLFSALPEAEKAAVMDALRSTGTDVQIDSTNGDITVPTSDYYNSRMSLAAQGLLVVPEKDSWRNLYQESGTSAVSRLYKTYIRRHKQFWR